VNGYSPTPIQPDGILDGLRWGCVLRGAVLDIALTLVLSIPLVLWLAGPAAFSEDDAAAQKTVDQALSSPEGLFWGAVLGLAATIIGAYYGARRAGALHVRHGGWVAVVSMALVFPLQLSSTAASSAAPLWYEILSLAAMIPAGLLGGFLASRVRKAPA